MIKITKLYTPRWKLREVLADIQAGRMSRTKAPLTVSKLGGGRYFVIDGNHRAVEGMLAGMTKYPTVLDAYTPDMNCCGGAHRGQVESVVPITDGLQSTNPPSAKLDRVLWRYASRIYDQVVTGITSGKIQKDTLYENQGSNLRGEWHYYLRSGKHMIDLIVRTPSWEGSIFVPDDSKSPVRITVPGHPLPQRGMFIHEFVHYMQYLQDRMPGTAPGSEVAEYLDQTHERESYFVQMVAEAVEPKFGRFAKLFPTDKKIAALVKKHFGSIWKVMHRKTRQHHVERTIALLHTWKNRIVRGKRNPS